VRPIEGSCKLSKYRRIEVKAFRHRVNIVSGEWRQGDVQPAQINDAVLVNDTDLSEPVKPDSPEGQLILVEAMRSLERRLSPETRAKICAARSTPGPSRSNRNGFFRTLQSLYQPIYLKLCASLKRRNEMRPSNPKRHDQRHISLVLALLLLTGVAMLVSGPTTSKAISSPPIWSAPVNLGPSINSTASDQQPAITPDGLSLYFTSNRIAGSLGGFDMYVSQRASIFDSFGPPVNLGPALNTTADEGNAAFSRDGRLLFFQSKRLPSLGGIDLFVAQRDNPHDDFDWQPAVNLGAAVNSAADDNGPAYFEDEVTGRRQLYFGSTRLGLADLYVSEQMSDGSFAPAARVTELNSPSNENDPSIRRDGLEVFFHSNRTGSTGPALDLWMATRASTANTWSAPINVGSAINTASAEQNAYLSSDGMTLFFSSDRTGAGGSGGLDLYMSTRTLPVVRSKNITVAADGSCVASISPSDVDDGSFDSVNGGPLTLSLDPAAAGPFGLGEHTVRLIATDDRGQTNSAIAIVTVVDQTPPAITAPPAVSVVTGPGNNSCGVFISDADLGNATASDNCSLTTTRAGVPADNFFPVGTTVITYTAIDGAGNTASATQEITVTDDTPPVITGASVDRPTLWPPHHQMVDVTVNYTATDNCGAVTTAVGVSSNEPINGPGDGDTAADWEVVNAHHVLLRAERSGQGNGRVYTITITATDSHGNIANQNVSVTVPHN